MVTARHLASSSVDLGTAQYQAGGEPTPHVPRTTSLTKLSTKENVQVCRREKADRTAAQGNPDVTAAARMSMSDGKLADEGECCRLPQQYVILRLITHNMILSLIKMSQYPLCARTIT